MVERNLAKVEVAGPSPVIRLETAMVYIPSLFFCRTKKINESDSQEKKFKFPRAKRKIHSARIQGSPRPRRVIKYSWQGGSKLPDIPQDPLYRLRLSVLRSQQGFRDDPDEIPVPPPAAHFRFAEVGPVGLRSVAA